MTELIKIEKRKRTLCNKSRSAISLAIVLLVFLLVVISALLGLDLFISRNDVATTAISTDVLTSQVTLIAPTTTTLTDVTSVTRTVLVTSTLQGIIPPINEVLISNVSLPEYTWAVAVNSNTNTIYAASPLANLTVIDGSTNQITASISLGPLGSNYVAIDSALNLVYSGNAVINGTDDKIIDHLPYNITNLAVDSQTGLIFALSPDFAPRGNTSLLILNAHNDSLEARQLLNGSATTLAVNPATNMVYIPICTKGNVCAPTYVIAVNGTSFHPQAKILVDSSGSSGIPFSIAVNSQTNMIYMTDQKLVSINGTTNTVTAETVVSAYTIQCRGVAVNEKYNEVYVAGWGFGNYGSFFIVNGQNYSLLNAFAGTGQPVGITYDQTNSGIYVANSQTKSILALNSTAFDQA